MLLCDAQVYNARKVETGCNNLTLDLLSDFEKA